jgi:transglutaminase-like putative cysteine protease
MTGLGRVKAEDLEPYLAPTWFIDCQSPAVRHRAEQAAGAASDEERAVRLFYAVRDGIRYDPYSVTSDPDDYRASTVLGRRGAFCVPKAVALTALARAVGIPARLGFADVRNHLATGQLLARLGTDLFVFHAFTEFRLAGRWVKATPAFNIELCERFGVRPLEFDGRNDALFHEYSADGRHHMEYVAERGSFADLPFEAMMRAFTAHYGQTPASSGRVRDEIFDPPGEASAQGESHGA